MYTPSILPIDTDQLSIAVQREFERLSQELRASQPTLLLDKINVAPSKPRPGMIVFADGVNWNPGSGAGYYGYKGTTWAFLG